MRTALLLLLLCLTSPFLRAQGVSWAIETWGNQQLGFDASWSGELATTGFTQNPPLFHGTDLSCGDTREKPFLARYHPDGSLMWARCLQVSDRGRGSRVAIESGGAVYLLGEFNAQLAVDSTALNTRGLTDVFLAKFSISGQLIWLRHIGGAENDYAYQMQRHPDGGVVISGKCHFPIQIGATTVTAPTYYGYENDYVARFDSAGSLQWTSVGQAIGAAPMLHVDQAGNTYLVGAYQNKFYWEQDSLPTAQADVFALRLSPGGQVAWLNRLSTPGLDEAYNFVGRRDGALFFHFRTPYHLAGDTIWYGPGGNQQAFVLADTMAGYDLLHLNDAGTWQWYKEYTPPSDTLDWSDVRLVLDNADSLHLVAQETEPIDSPAFQIYGLRQMRIGATGGVLASQRFELVKGIGHLGIDAWQNLYLYGSYLGGVQLGPFNLTSSTGAYSSFLARIGLVVGVPEPGGPTLTVQAFPNPTGDGVQVQLAEPMAGRWWLCDLQGRRLAEGQCIAGQGQLSLAPYAPGIYLLHVQAGARRSVLRLVRQ